MKDVAKIGINTIRAKEFGYFLSNYDIVLVEIGLFVFNNVERDCHNDNYFVSLWGNVDNMDAIRELVYVDKASIDDFGIDDNGSLNQIIFDNWLLGRAEINPFGSNNHIASYLKVFNDAYYACTLILLLPNGKFFHSNYLKDRVEYPSIVIPLVCLYLSKLTNKSIGIERFLKNSTGAGFKNEVKWLQNYNELIDAVSGYEGNIEPDMFAQRELTREILSEIKWWEVTNHFEKKQIEVVVRVFARNREIWKMMVEAIKAAAKKYDYDFAFEDEVINGVDEDGLYTQIVKVPKNPYDNDGNEILEPLKRAGVYQFCDELMEKYDELALNSIGTIDPNNRKERQPKVSQHSTQEDKSVFYDNINPVAITEALRGLKSEFVIRQKRGEREFFKIVHDAFKKLGWLNDSQKVHFTKWARRNNIMEAKTDGFKGLNNHTDDVLLNAVLNSFSEKQENGCFKDKDEFYKKTPQGETKRKINNG